jgi:hypothetical protein
MGAGTPVTMEWLNEPLQEEWFEQYYLPEQKRLMQAMVDGNITQEDLDGFQGFSDQPPPGRGYRYDHEGVLKNNRDVPIAGVYSKSSGMIHISKRRLYANPKDLKNTVVHEIGHHRIDQKGLIRGSARRNQGRQVIRRANLKTYTSDQLANAGLRPYSTASGGELLADTFVVMRNGTPEQKALLTNIWGEAGYDDLAQIYKALGLVFANELRAVDDGDTVDLILAPTMITRAVYEKTPWYYVDVTYGLVFRTNLRVTAPSDFPHGSPFGCTGLPAPSSSKRVICLTS